MIFITVSGECDWSSTFVKEVTYLAARSTRSSSGKSMSPGIHMNVMLLLIELWVESMGEVDSLDEWVGIVRVVVIMRNEDSESAKTVYLFIEGS